MPKRPVLLVAAACSLALSQAVAAADALPALLERPAVSTDERIGQLRQIADAQAGGQNFGNAGSAGADAQFSRAKADNAATASESDVTSVNFSINTRDFSLIGNKGGASDISGGGVRNVNALAVHVVRLLMIGLSLMCTIFIVLGGINLTFTGSEKSRDSGKRMIVWSIFGLAVALSSYLIVSLVGWVLE